MVRNIIQEQYELVLLMDLLQYNYLDVLISLEHKLQKMKKREQKVKIQKDLLHKNKDKKAHDQKLMKFLMGYLIHVDVKELNEEEQLLQLKMVQDNED
jgi:hypothetical protein